MKKWLDIIGVDERGIKALGANEQALLRAARNVLGPQRFIDQLASASLEQKHISWQPPFSLMIKQVEALGGTKSVILASGDPNWFGIGASLARHLKADEFTLHPALSAFQLAAARLHWPLQNIATISLHGRAVESLHRYVVPGNRILALTSGSATLFAAAKILVARKYGHSRLSVLENLGAKNERIISFLAKDADQQNIGEFFTLAIDCVADVGAPLLPAIPGLPDDFFNNDGQLTKREVRAISLARLAPFAGALLWDVGAGSGSVAIEWMRAAPGAKAICFEKDLKRCDLIAQNRLDLGVPSLEIVAGTAPASLAGRPSPDAIFIGGNVNSPQLFDACYKALKAGGIIVANAVTLEGEAALIEHHKRLGGELVQIAISRLKNIGSLSAFQPRLPITQFIHVKEPQ
ncbi:Precorrin-6Y C(5,15)-methyltransferase [decarboxylating] [hydrothermal vent metagenome]|uniref:Precorrin-6Y C(5,15)-methyltransferase [decarboxylating] n=1 Tax=hydrothermal vent metagenome TaxID=652676 RepID=A0A3B0UGP1_9ZZZZ